MPSRTANKNKMHLPPFPPPEGRKCISVSIPDDPQWIALFYGALYRLAQQIWYDRDPEHTAALVAAVWQDIYLSTLKNENDCAMPGECCPLRINPFNGRLQQSDDGGLTWFDVADGPWTESLYPPFSATPRPRPELTDKDCAAATTAAFVLTNLYRQTGETLLNVVATTDWDYVSALGTVITGFLMIVGAVAAQPYVAVSVLLGIVGVRQQYVDYPLDADDEERLKCILLEHATVDASGSVTFDFQAVWSSIDLASPKNGLVRFLLTMIGPDALNYAGAIDAGIEADCSECGAWCYTWDFTVNNGDWSVWSGGTYLSGTGWRTTRIADGSTYKGRVGIHKTFAESLITQVVVTFGGDNGTIQDGNAINNQIQIYRDGVQESNVVAPDNYGPNLSLTYNNVGILSDEVRIKLEDYYTTNNSGVNGTITTFTVTIRGVGTNPFGEDNC